MSSTSYITGAFPSACGKTNLSMLVPPEQYKKAGWKTSIVGDDIAWMWPQEDGKLHAINPETGYFGVAPGTSWESNPTAMLPFAGYNMGSYFRHWFQLQKQLKLPPRFFHVNWFRRDTDGGFLWPGFGENIRVLEWIIHRCNGQARAHETRIGWVPEASDFNLDGVDVDAEHFARLMAFDPEEWKLEVISQSELFLRLFHTMPKQLVYERELLSARLS